MPPAITPKLLNCAYNLAVWLWSCCHGCHYWKLLKAIKLLSINIIYGFCYLPFQSLFFVHYYQNHYYLLIKGHVPMNLCEILCMIDALKLSKNNFHTNCCTVVIFLQIVVSSLNQINFLCYSQACAKNQVFSKHNTPKIYYHHDSANAPISLLPMQPSLYITRRGKCVLPAAGRVYGEFDDSKTAHVTSCNTNHYYYQTR